MTTLDFQAFDADNHYYEATDAFTRYIEPEYAKRAMQWAEINGKTRLLVGGRINRFIPNPTFDPVSKPGALDEYFRGRNPKSAGVRDLFGELDPISPAYRDRDARLATMDAQGLGGAFFFPTLGVGMEQSLIGDPPALTAAFRAFNRWLDEDWGFAYQERIFAAPYIPLVDIDNAVAQLEWALERDARIIITGVGPVVTAAGGSSPVDPRYDAFWSRVDEAGVTVALHGGDSAYSHYIEAWGESAEMEAFRASPLRGLLSHDPMHDTVAAMLASQFFHRFPRIRVASIELGSTWAFHLFEKLAKVFGQAPNAFPEDPRETFRRHVWVSPFYEDDLAALKGMIGVDRILMGSDWPHAEGLADPVSYIDDLRRFDYTDDEARKVMADNGWALTKVGRVTFPSDVGIIDLGMGFPYQSVEEKKAAYTFFRANLRDRQSLEEMEFPAEYMFKNAPDVISPDEDPVAWTVAKMDAFGIEQGMVGMSANGLRAKAEHPGRFHLMMRVDPNQGLAALRALSAAKEEHGIVSAMTFPSGNVPQVAVNDKKMYPIYMRCVELGIPICINGGIVGPRMPSWPQYVEHFDQVLYDFPELTMVMMHGGEPWTALAVKLMLKWPGLHYMTSAFAPKHYPADIIRYANSRGAEKIMFCGYFPAGLTLERQMDELPGVPFKDEVWPMFLRENARRVFRLDQDGDR